jgi:hypothetical protein
MTSPQLDLRLSRAEAVLLLVTLRIISDYQDVRLQKGVLGVIEQRLEHLMEPEEEAK